MANLGQLQITADVSETDVASVQTGQTATITLNALTGKTFAGTVAAISPTATIVSNVVEYAVTINVTSAMPSTVRTGQSASITITTDSATNALYVPNTAITTLGGRSLVTVVANGKDTPTAVTLGVVGTTTYALIDWYPNRATGSTGPGLAVLPLISPTVQGVGVLGSF